MHRRSDISEALLNLTTPSKTPPGPHITEPQCCPCRKLSEAQAEHKRALASLATASESAESAKAAASERLKRFNLLNSQFKKREAALQAQVAEAQVAAAGAEAEVQQMLGRASHQEQACTFPVVCRY